jgi:hypothetical protein
MPRVPHTSSPRREQTVHSPLERDYPMRFTVIFTDTYLSREIYIITENIIPTVKYSRDIIRTLASLQCEQYLNCKFPLTHIKYRSDKNRSRDKIPNNSNQIANHSRLCIPPTQQQHNKIQYVVRIHSRFIQLK